MDIWMIALVSILGPTFGLLFGIWLQTHQKPQRKVFLQKMDGELRVVNAFPSDSGWVARWIELDSEWSLLLPNGKVKGTSSVVAWLPHTGWQEKEFTKNDFYETPHHLR